MEGALDVAVKVAFEIVGYVIERAVPDHDSAMAASEDAWDRRPKREDYLSDAVYQADHNAWQEAADAIEAARSPGPSFFTTTAAASPHSSWSAGP
ncbi:hypothetical protein ACIREE_40510 [Streptomyces sp. NPDC102467]|uniref:hypothetical protein n=1 Tax=Streptomyces sp. NPDC102467 TaxID=3366179 RepID=UPI0038234D51